MPSKVRGQTNVLETERGHGGGFPTDHMMLDRHPGLWKPQFSHLESGDTKLTLIELFLKMNQLMSVKPLCWASVTRVVNIIIIILFDFVVMTVISGTVVVN